MDVVVARRRSALIFSLMLLVSTVGYGAIAIRQAAATTPTGAPEAPSIEVEPADGYLAVSGFASSEETDHYVYSLDSGPWTLLSSDSGSPGSYGISGSIPSLSNGTPYTVAFEAVNSAGSSAASAPVTVTAGAPQAPTSLSATAGNGSATVAFADSDNNGFAITGYQYAIVGSPQGYQPLTLTGGAPGSGGAITGKIAGLSDGLKSIEIQAVGTNGASPAALTSVTVGAPGSPKNLVVTPSGSTAQVSFTVGADNGASITGYSYSVVNSSGGAQTPTTTLTPSVDSDGTLTSTISGLSDGDNQLSIYPMYQSNTSRGEPASQSFVTTNQAPQQGITDLDIESGDGTAAVSFQDSWAAAGAASTGYEYTIDGGGTWHALVDASGHGLQFFTSSAWASMIPITGLANGQSVNLQIRAVNTAGHGPASTPVTATVGAPGEPPMVNASAGDRQALLEIEPSAPNGAPVTSYDYSTDGVNWRPANATIPSDGSYPQAVIANLVDGQHYSIYVRGVNSRGAGMPTSWATTVTPGQADDVYPAITPGSGSATLAIDESTFSNGGSPILSYQASTDGGASWKSLTIVSGTPGGGGKLTATITGLTNGISYGVDVRAVTALGDGASDAVQTVVPGQPLAPTIMAATPGDESATVNFVEASGGGTTIASYEYTIDGSIWHPLTITAGTPGHGGALTATIAALTNRMTYYNVAVRAEGTPTSGPIVDGAPASIQSVTPGQALAPDFSNTIAIAGNGSATLTFDETANGGAPITGYQQSSWDETTPSTNASYRRLAITAGAPGSGGTITGAVSGLTNGHIYDVSIRAITALGDGQTGNAALVTPTAQPPTPAAPTPPAPVAPTSPVPMPTPIAPTAPTPVALGPVTPTPATATPLPALPSVGSGAKPGTPTVAAANAAVTEHCALANSAVASCVVTFSEIVRGHKVVLGSGRSAGATVKVALNASGKAAIATPGGARLTVQASITAANGTALAANTTAVVVAPTVTVKAPISFASAGLSAAARHAIAVLRSQMGKAKSVTCSGFVDSDSSAALARREAAEVCAALVKGTHVLAIVLGRGAAQPVASNATALGRAANRRVTIVLHY